MRKARGCSKMRKGLSPGCGCLQGKARKQTPPPPHPHPAASRSICPADTLMLAGETDLGLLTSRTISQYHFLVLSH